MPFDPSKPFTRLESSEPVETKGFDPSKPFTRLESSRPNRLLEPKHDMDIDAAEGAAAIDFISKAHGLEFNETSRDYEPAAKAAGFTGNPKADFSTIKHRQETLDGRNNSIIKRHEDPNAFKRLGEQLGHEQRIAERYTGQVARDIPSALAKSGYDILAGTADVSALALDKSPLGLLYGAVAGESLRESGEESSAFYRELADFTTEAYGVNQDFEESISGQLIGGVSTVATNIATLGGSIPGQFYTEAIRDSEESKGKKFADFTQKEKDLAAAKGVLYMGVGGLMESAGANLIVGGKVKSIFANKMKGLIPKARDAKAAVAGLGEGLTEMSQGQLKDTLAVVIEGDDRDLVSWEVAKMRLKEGALGTVIGTGASVGFQGLEIASKSSLGGQKAEIDAAMDRQQPFSEDGSYNPNYRPMPIYDANGNADEEIVNLMNDYRSVKMERDIEEAKVKAKKADKAEAVEAGEEAEVDPDEEESTLPQLDADLRKMENKFSDLIDARMEQYGQTDELGSEARTIQTYNVKLAAGLDPLRGATETDWKYIDRNFSDEETSSHVLQATGDAELVPIALAAKKGDTEAQQAYIDATTVKASEDAVAAGLTAEEAAAEGRKPADARDLTEEDFIPETEAESVARIEAEKSTAEQEKLDEAGEMIQRFNDIRSGHVDLTYTPDEMKLFADRVQQWRDSGMAEEDVQAKIISTMVAQGMAREKVEGIRIRGEQSSNRAVGNEFRAQVKLYNQADPFDVIEEYAHVEYDRELAAGIITEEQVTGWRKDIEAQTSGEDTRGNTAEDNKEWMAEQVKARAIGNQNADIKLPASFKRFLQRMFERMRALFNRAAEIAELDARGMLPEGFGEALDRHAALSDTEMVESSMSLSKDEKVVEPPSGTPTESQPATVIDPDVGSDLPSIDWSDPSYSLSPKNLPELYPEMDAEIFAKISADTDNIAVVQIDRMRVGEYNRTPLQGGMFYPTIVENLEKRVVWAFNKPGVARDVLRRVADTNGYAMLVLMEEGNVVGNKTFTDIWFNDIDDAVKARKLTKKSALAHINAVRKRYAKKTGHSKNWKTLEEARTAIFDMGQMKRGATYMQRSKVTTKVRGLHTKYGGLLIGGLVKDGFPNAESIVGQIEEPAFNGMAGSTVVGLIRFDEHAEDKPIPTAEEAGVTRHMSYGYVLHGEPVAKMKNQVSLDEMRPASKKQLLTQAALKVPAVEAMSFSLGGSTVTPNAQTQTFPTKEGGVVGPASFSLSAHHGTPHEVGKFSTDKMGTGEGAQVYGWGLYFAELFTVANEYREMLTRLKRMVPHWTMDGKPIDEYVTPDKVNLDNIALADGDPEPELERLRRRVQQYNDKGSQYIESGTFTSSDVSEIISETEASIKWITENITGEELFDYKTHLGNVYTVDLDVDVEEMLDWDKPLNEQSPQVQAALKTVISNNSDLWESALKENRNVGGSIYATLRATWPDAEFTEGGIDPSKLASEALAAAGIKGVKFLDQGSRDAAAGTSNFVIFNDSDITITHENGEVVETAPSFSLSPAPETAEFKSWFGDSKVVDENGEPLVVKHGTTSPGFESFDLNQKQVSGDVGKLGFFFTNNDKYADAYASEGYPYKVAKGGAIIPVYLSIKNPKRESLETMEEMEMDFTPSEVEAYGKSLRDSGYDGIIFKGDGGVDEYVAFEPTQIKSAFNRGTFDPADPRISFSLSPEESYDEDVQALAEEVAVRTPERQAYMDYAREVRQTDGDNTEKQKARLELLLKRADDTDDFDALIQSGNLKYAAYVKKTSNKIRRQAEERGEVTQAIRAFEALLNSSAVPKEVRGKMLKAFPAISDKLTAQGKAREIARRTHSLELRMNEHNLAQNQMALRKFMHRYTNATSKARAKLMKRVGGKGVNDLDFAAALLRNPDAMPKRKLIVEHSSKATPEEIEEAEQAHEDYLRETFGGALSYFQKVDGKRTLQRSTPERVAEALIQAQSIAKDGRTARDQFETERKARKAKRNKEILKHVLKGERAKGGSELRTDEASKGSIRKNFDLLSQVMFHHFNGFKQAMNIIDGITGGKMERMFYPQVVASNAEEVALNIENKARTQEDLDEVLGNDDVKVSTWYKAARKIVKTKIEWNDGRGASKKKLSKMQGVSLYMQWLDKSTRPTMAKMEIDQNVIDQVIEFIGIEGVSLANYLRSRYNESGKAMAAVHLATEGFPLDLVEGYGGKLNRIGFAKDGDEPLLQMGLEAGKRPTVKNGSQKARIANTNPLHFPDAMVAFDQHMRETNHYVSHAALVKELQDTFKFSRDEFGQANAVTDAIQQRHGVTMLKDLQEVVDRIIEGGVKFENAWERKMNKIRGQLTQAALSIKPAIMVKQLGSAPAFIEAIDTADYAAAWTTMMRNPVKWNRAVYDTQYVQNRMSRLQYADIQQELNIRDNRYRAMSNLDVLMLNVKAGDIGGVVLGGTPIYIHYYQKAKAAKKSDAEASAIAEAMLAEASEDAQQSAAEHTKGHWLASNRAFVRGFFMYTTSPIMYQRKINVAMLNMANQIIDSKQGKPAEKMKAAKQLLKVGLIYHVLLPQIFQAIASGITTWSSDDDDVREQFMSRQKKALLLGNFAVFPQIGRILTAISDRISGTDEVFDSTGSPILDAVADIDNAVTNMLEGELTLQDIYDVTEEALNFKGIPLETGRKYYEGIEDIFEGDTEYPLQHLGGWSRWSLMEGK